MTNTVEQAKRPEVDPLEESRLHRLLVNTNRIQTLPAWVIILLIGVDAAMVGFAWNWSLLVIAGFVVSAAANWALLLALPRTGRSFGPDKPSALALAALNAVCLAFLGLIGASWLAAWAFLGIMTLLAIYATWIEPFRLGVTRQNYTTAKWKTDAAPLRLLQIGDIHMERVTPRERQLNTLIQELQPDIIVFTGDYVNLSNTHDPQAEAAIREIIGEWRAPLGVYCISGTPLVEPLERVQAFVKDLDNLKLLPNQWLSKQTPGGMLNILGLVVTHDMDKDRALLQRMMMTAPKDGLHLLLMHPPDIAPEANEAGIDLYLCGHTHGGQMRLPLIGAVFSSSHLGNQFIMGRYELGNTTLYTSRGVGLEGLGAPRARFLCPPEIILWEIRGSGA